MALGSALFAFVDLTPRVDADFFFSSDDPQLESSVRIEDRFGAIPQVFVVAHTDDLVSAAYVERIHALTEDLTGIPGVVDVRSMTKGAEETAEVLEDIREDDVDDVFEDLTESPFWSALVLAPDSSATFVVIELESAQGNEATVRAIDETIARHRHPDFRLGASGVPYVSEHIRARLSEDLRTFSLVAIGAFGVLVSLLFRSLPVLVGTLVAALTASFATFLVRAAMGMETDILSPNLWMIAFVLTLSHVVYLTAAWRRRAAELGSEGATRESIRLTGPASAWSLIANLLGFATLVFVSAKPIRQLGISGVIAALAAMICAYGIFPLFLRGAAPRLGKERGLHVPLERFFTRTHGALAAMVVLAALLLAPFARRVDTDPTLPSYFSPGDPIHAGIDAMDVAGGSSPLDLVVGAPDGATLGNDAGFERLSTLHARLAEHPDVGSVVSIALLMAETKRPWYSFIVSWNRRLEALDSAENGRVGRTFLTEDRREGRFILRMREGARSRPRDEVIREIETIVRDTGLEPRLVGGLYPLQGELSELVEGSVVRGLSGLLACFFVITIFVTRSMSSALAMVLCLALSPLILFGLAGISGMSLDIISAPAANVALPLGIDEMIHLGYAMRRHRDEGRDEREAWRAALSQMWLPILYSMLIVGSGFALFLLSSFPPTRRLGILVSVGAVLTDLVVLVVLPAILVILHRLAGRRAPSPAIAPDAHGA